MIELIKDENICIEACPVSNNVLGYVNDLRSHPARALMTKGVKVTISPDD
jgi:adenosine deaminase CECR1